MTQPTTVAADPAQRSPAVDELIRGMHAERERNRAFFEAHCDDLFAEHSEDWLLIHSGGEVIASDNLMALNDQRLALDTVQRGGAVIEARPRQPSDPPPLDPFSTPPVIKSGGPLNERSRAVHDEHRRNVEFFERHQEELFAKYPKMWLLIHSGGEVVASKDLLELNDLRETFDSVTRAAALFEIKRPWPMIPSVFFTR